MMTEAFTSDVDETLLIESLRIMSAEIQIGTLEDLDKVNY
jgi:hypothetical protein